MRRALVVGIDDYPDHPLSCCVNDAIEIASILETNDDGSPNFSMKILTSNQEQITRECLNLNIGKLFSTDADTVLFYFAGHGIINPDTNAGYIVSQDGKDYAWGVSISEIVGLANKAYPKIKSTIIILDCCHAGFAGQVPGLDENISIIGTGVTILTACGNNEASQESQNHGLFTEMLLDGLRGSASDICGRVTPASIYAHVDQTLAGWEQRPIYKANVRTFITLRNVKPKVPLGTLRKLPEYFEDPTSVFSLDPSFEPDRKNIPDEFKNIPINQTNVLIFKELQQCNRHGLIQPVDVEHMYDAAISSTGCKLTPLGAHYRKLAKLKRI